jgi:uridylate kinase
MLKYKKILLKLSGEALAGALKSGYSENELKIFCSQIIDVHKKNVKIGIVVGGGNLFRGLTGLGTGLDRVKGDYMGMLATVMNALALQSTFNALDAKAKVLTSTFMEPYAERYSPDRAKNYLDNGYIVIFAGGTSNPFLTTDSAAALRAVEIGADILLKGTNIDGVYNDDPRKNPNATKYSKVSFDEAIEKQLKVMDITAFTLCRENNLPIRVFDIHKKGNLEAVVDGQNIGTLVF